MPSSQSSPHLLTSQELVRHSNHLLRIGQLRRPITGAGPGTEEDLRRMDHDTQAISKLALALGNLESDGKIYIHARDVYIYLTPANTLFNTKHCSPNDFVDRVQRFQHWIDLRQAFIATSAVGQTVDTMTESQRDATLALTNFETDPNLLTAYEDWIRNWASSDNRAYTVCALYQGEFTLKLPAITTLLPSLPSPKSDSIDAEPGETVVSVLQILLIRTVTGQTLVTNKSHDSAHLMTGHEIRYSQPMSENLPRVPLYCVSASASTAAAAAALKAAACGDHNG